MKWIDRLLGKDKPPVRPAIEPPTIIDVDHTEAIEAQKRVREQTHRVRDIRRTFLDRRAELLTKGRPRVAHR